MMPPEQPPIGLQLARTARLVGRAFDDALAEAGGSLPVWLILLNLRLGRSTNQRQLAEAVGISGATLTHHLNAMEGDGLLSRRRDPSNRRNHIVEISAAGEQAFISMAAAARVFDERLRASLSPAELTTLRTLLGKLSAGVGSPQSDAPWPRFTEAASHRPARAQRRRAKGAARESPRDP